MKQYKRHFKESQNVAPRTIVATHCVGGNTVVSSNWESFEISNSKKNFGSFLSRIGNTVLKKGDNYESAYAYINNSGSHNLTLRVVWKNNNVLLGAMIQYNSEKQITDDGWNFSRAY